MLTYGLSPSTENISDRLTGIMGVMTENLLKINGFFNSLHQKTVTETEVYNWWVSNPDFKGKS